MIEMCELTKSLRGKNILDKLSCEIHDNEIYGVVGPNGSGKSTLLRSLSGIYFPDEGSVKMDGHIITENPKLKREIFFVPSEIYFVDNATICNLVMFYSKIYLQWDDKKFNHFCSLFFIDVNKKACLFDSGTKKLIWILLALASNAKLVLIDELPNDMDLKMKQSLISLIKEHSLCDGRIIVVVSNNLAQVEELCSKVSLLLNGKLYFSEDQYNLSCQFCKFQFICDTSKEKKDIESLGIKVSSFQKQGSIVSFIAKGDRKVILEKLHAFAPTFLEDVPCTLEEIYTCVIEELGREVLYEEV